MDSEANSLASPFPAWRERMDPPLRLAIIVRVRIPSINKRGQVIRGMYINMLETVLLNIELSVELERNSHQSNVNIL